jgi:hypothetical protein
LRSQRKATNFSEEVDMPIHMGFRDKVTLGLGVIKMATIGMNMGGVRTRVAPGEVIEAGKGMKHRQRVTTVESYNELLSELHKRGKQFMPDGWHDMKDRLPSIKALFDLHNGLRAHLITHNADPGRMKRLELETPVGNTLIAWTDS